MEKRFGPQKWWCEVCDANQVDSTDPNTGKFYLIHGVEHPAGGRDNWTSVLFAVCCNCNPMDAMRCVNVEDMVDRTNKS